MADAGVRLSRELFLRSFLGGPAATNPWLLDRLTSILEERTVHAGEVLYREGDPADRLHFMANGRVRMSRGGLASYVYSGRWIVGGVDALAGRVRRRTAVTLADSALLTARSDDWFEVLEDTLETARDLIGLQMAMSAKFYERIAPSPYPEPAAPTPVPSRRLSLFDRLLVYFDGAIVRKAGVQTLSILAEASEEVRLAEGEELLAADASRDHVFIVAHGHVQTTQENPGMQGIFGRSSFLAGLSATSKGWSARAMAPSVVLALPIEEWFDAMTHFDLVRCVMAWSGLERERVVETLAERSTTELVLE